MDVSCYCPNCETTGRELAAVKGSRDALLDTMRLIANNKRVPEHVRDWAEQAIATAQPKP